MTQHVLFEAGQVEVCVIGKVQNRRGIGHGGEGKLKGMVVTPLVTGCNLKVAGITGLTVFREVHELNCGIAVPAALPNLVLEAVGAAVKMVGAVVYRQCVLFAVKGEFALCDAVGIAARTLACARAVGHVGLGGRIAQDNIGKHAFAVRDNNGNNGCAKGREFYIGAVGCCKPVFLYFLHILRILDRTILFLPLRRMRPSG